LEQPLALGVQLPVEAVDEIERLPRESVCLYANWASSVDPCSASVEDSLEIA